MQLSSLASQVGLVAKNPLANARDIRVASSIPGLGRSPGEGTSNPLQYSCLGNPMDRGAWWATAQVVTGLDMAEPVHIAVVVQLSSHVQLFATPWTAAGQASPSLSISWSLPKFMFIAFVMPSSHLILWHPLLLPLSILPNIMDFSSESSVHIKWPKYWSFSFAISPSSEYSGLISLEINWLNLLAIQGAFKSLFQHHSLKASTLWCSAFFMVQLSHRYMTTGKTKALSIRTFVIRVIYQLWNILSRFVMAFLPGSNHLQFHGCTHHPQWFWSPKRGNLPLLFLFPFYLPCSNGAGCHDLSFF